jgi:phage terminase large subunit
MIILQAIQKPMRVLCARELQTSIRDSVHRLISDQVTAMGLDNHFEIGESFIRTKIGGEFIFRGLRHNAGEIKSMENIGLCWIEEAQAVSESSWELLIPTIRAPGSEIWLTFNPNEESDPTYQRFVVNAPPNSLIKKVNWQDNPWFPKELADEKDYLARVDPDAYLHVWEGECRTHSEAQILHGKISIDEFEPTRDWSGPYLGSDWGFAKDPTAVIKAWIHGRNLYIEHEAWGIGVEIDALPSLFDEVPGSRNYTIRGDSARPETINYLQRHGFRIVSAAKGKGSVEDGVSHLRSYEKIIVHPRCSHFIAESRAYRYKTDKLTNDILPEIVDADNHLIDALRYALEPIIQGARTEKKEKKQHVSPVQSGWMG